MKRLLALFLAVLMVIPAAIVPTVAESAASAHKLDDCCEILATDFTNIGAYNQLVGANANVGMLAGYQAFSITTVEGSGNGTVFKAAYRRTHDTGLAASEDISDMTHLVFDLYISDASMIMDQQKFYIELTSAAGSDSEEISTAPALEELVGKSLVSGWNHVEIALNSMKNSSSDSTVFDSTAWDFFRIYNSGVFPAGVTIGLANMYFMNANCAEHYSHMTDSFTVRGAGDSAHLIGELSNGNTSTAGAYFMDSERQLIYRFDNVDGNRIDHATITTTISQQPAIWVSKSVNGPWASVYQYKTTYMNEKGNSDPDGSQLPSATRTYDLTTALATIPGNSNQLYVKIGDSYPAGGWGGKITGEFTLDVRYDESIPEQVENTVTHSFTVLGSDEAAYLYDDKSSVAQDANKINYSRYADQHNYFTYRFPLGNAQEADALYFTAQTRAQLSLQVSTDNATWIEVANAGTTQTQAANRAYDLLAPLKSASNTATSADYLYVRIGDSNTSDGFGGGLSAYTNVSLRAVINGDVDVRAYESNAFLLFTAEEQSYLVYDDSFAQAVADGSYNKNYKNNDGSVKNNAVETVNGITRTKANAQTGDSAANDHYTIPAANLMADFATSNASNINKFTFKYNDGPRHIIYQYSLSTSHLYAADRLTFQAYMGNKILITVSVDGGKTWPYTIYTDGDTNYADKLVTVDLLSIAGLKDALIKNDGNFQLCIQNTDTAGYGAKLIGYDAKVYATDTGERDEDTGVHIYNHDAYPCRPRPVSMTMEYDANTAGVALTSVENTFNFVGEPIYSQNTGTRKEEYPYCIAMPTDPNEPLYRGLDTAGNTVPQGRMSENILATVNTATQATGAYDGNWNGRFHDASYFIYYYPIANVDTTLNMTLSLPLGGQYGIKVAVGSNVCPEIRETGNVSASWGGDDWVFLTDYIAQGGSGNGSGGTMSTFSIDPTVFGDDIATATHIYFMFYDVVPSDSYGARIALGMYKNGQPARATTFSYYSTETVRGIDSAATILTEDFNINYAVSNIDTDETPIFAFTFGDDVTKLVTATKSNGVYSATFEGIMPYRMAETISAKLYVTVDGVVHTFERDYSVKDYCQRMLAKSTSAELTNLLNAILAYGDTAQDYVGYQTDAKPSTNVDGYTAPTTTYTLGTYTNYRGLSGTAVSATWKSATLMLGSETMVALTFESADVSGLTVRVNDEEVAYTALGNNLYRVEIPVMPNQFNNALSAVFVKGGVAEDHILTYSVGSYFETRYESSSEATKAMLDALYNYGTATLPFAPAN